MSMPSLKDDSSFKEFISLGAVATEKVIEALNKKGHNVIELERGALSNRMWENKEKRLRVPDLLCLNCGRRIESRGKKALEIKMSHSTSDESRSWDYDCRDRDWVALVKCYKTGERFYEWEKPDVINVVSYADLRRTSDKTKTDRGGRTQGSELTIEWPSTTASADGHIKRIKEEDKRIQISRASDGYTLSYSLEKKIDDEEYVSLEPLVDVGENVLGEEQLIAAPFELVHGESLECDSNYSKEDFVSDLDSESFNDRFSAIKALGFESTATALEKLEAIVIDEEKNKFVRLEAAASLAKQGNNNGWDYIESILNDGSSEERLEVAIILGEINDKTSDQHLKSIFQDEEELEEIRAEAAHSLGNNPSREGIQSLIEGVKTDSLQIKKDCISSISENFRKYDSILKEALRSDNEDIRWGSAIALAESDVNVIDFLEEHNCEFDEDVIIISLSLVDTPEDITGVAPELQSSINILSKYFTSWADIMTEDLRYRRRKSSQT